MFFNIWVKTESHDALFMWGRIRVRALRVCVCVKQNSEKTKKKYYSLIRRESMLQANARPYFSSFAPPEYLDLLCLSSANHYQFSEVLSYQLQTGTSSTSAPN